jgi:hypothetical protein
MNSDQIAKLENHDVTLYGRNGDPGVAHKINFLWRFHVYLLCGASTCLGFLLHWLAAKLGMIT